LRYLLDTHVFLWALAKPENLSKTAIDLIENPENILFLSSASIWEISIKQTIGKLKILDKSLDLKTFVEKAIEDLNLLKLSIQFEHIYTLHNIPYHHKDPFDRILIAQSVAENLILITDDKIIKKYKVRTIW